MAIFCYILAIFKGILAGPEAVAAVALDGGRDGRAGGLDGDTHRHWHHGARPALNLRKLEERRVIV